MTASRPVAGAATGTRSGGARTRLGGGRGCRGGGSLEATVKGRVITSSSAANRWNTSTKGALPKDLDTYGRQRRSTEGGARKEGGEGREERGKTTHHARTIAQSSLPTRAERRHRKRSLHACSCTLLGVAQQCEERAGNSGHTPAAPSGAQAPRGCPRRPTGCSRTSTWPAEGPASPAARCHWSQPPAHTPDACTCAYTHMHTHALKRACTFTHEVQGWRAGLCARTCQHAGVHPPTTWEGDQAQGERRTADMGADSRGVWGGGKPSGQAAPGSA
jgi:hypothetical protein